MLNTPDRLYRAERHALTAAFGYSLDRAQANLQTIVGS